MNYKDKNKIMSYLKVTLSIVTISLFTACGAGESKDDSTSEENKLTSKEILQQQTTDTKTNTSEVINVEEEIVELIIEADDQMQYNLDELKVQAGSTVKLTLKHVGQLAKSQMGHNWVLLQKETNIMQFSQKASSAQDNNYIPKEEESKVIAYTDMLGGGEER